MKEIVNPEFSEMNWRRCKNDYRKTRSPLLIHLALALAGEAGELANIVKKIDLGTFTAEEVIDQLDEELADIFTYYDLLCSEMGIDRTASIAKKFNKVSDKIGSSERFLSE